MSNNLNIRSQTTLRELEETLSNLNVPIVMFKELLKAIKNNDFSSLSDSVSKLRYMTSEEKVKEQIDSVIYQQVYDNTDYNNLILLITKIYSIIDSLVEARMNITDVYKQDIEVVEDMLQSYGFDIHKIFDEKSKRDLANRIYYFLRRKGTPHLIGEFLNRLGYTHYAINEYSLNRDNMEWKFIPETVEISDAAKEWEKELDFQNIDLNDVDDSLWYLDEDTLNDVLFKNTRLYSKNWNANYEIIGYDFLSRYLGLSITDEVTIDSVSFSKCGEKMAIACEIWYRGWKQISDTEFELIENYEVKDGFGNTLMYISDTNVTRKSVFIVNLKTEEVEKEYVMHDGSWYDYYLNWYIENYPSWEPYTEYKKDDIVIYSGSPKICQRDHISSSSFNYTQDGIRTWYTYSFNDNWWINEGYIDDCDLDYYTFFTTCFDDLNNIYIVLDWAEISEFFKINILNDTVTIMDIKDFKNKFTDITFKDFFGEDNWYEIIGKYNDYLIFGQPSNWNADHTIYMENTYVFFNLKEKTWFSLYDRFFKYYPTTSFDINVFDIYHGFYSHEIMQNKLWFTVNINYKNYLMGLDLKDIVDHVNTVDSFGSDTFIENVEQKENYVKNIMDNYFKISLDDFDPDFMVEFLIGRDGSIYISGASLYIEEIATYEDWFFDNIFILKVFDKRGKEIKKLFSGEMLSPWGMDHNNNIFCTISANTGYWPEATIYVDHEMEEYVSIYFFPIIKLNPIFCDFKESLENSNIKINTVNYLNADYVDPNNNYYEFNEPLETEIDKVNIYNKSFTYKNELFVTIDDNIYKYNTFSNCWKDVSPPVQWRKLYYGNHRASVQYNGKVYFLGRLGANILTIYDLLNKTAVLKELSFNLVNYYTMELINKKIYIFGGHGDSYDEYFNTLWEYDIINDIWTEKTPCPSNRGYHSATVYNNKMYVFGGKSSDYSTSDRRTWEYDPSNDTWTQKADFPGEINSRQHAATTIGDKMYYYVERAMWEYDPISNTWISKASGSSEMPDYSGYIMETINGKAYLEGGSIGSTSNYTNKLWEYDPISNTWTQKSSTFCEYVTPPQ